MLDYLGLAALNAVIREGSFERAARRLHITASAVSQRVKQLEERMGQILVLRGQPCTGTELGQRLCLHLEQVGLLENELRRAHPELADDGQSIAPTLKLAVNADSLSTWFMQAMAEFTQGGNELLDIGIDDQNHTAQRIRQGEVMAAVTATASPIAGCNTWPLGTMAYVAAASPSFVARHLPDGPTPEALARAPMLIYDRKDRLQDQWLQAQGLAPRRPPPAHWLPSVSAFIGASQAGIGWGMHPLIMVERELREGRLVPLLPQAELDVPLYWVHTRMAQPGLQRLTDCVMRAARERLIQQPAQ
ncbi:ArgP/LysG family DNA-binding transcriptional regulator [Comamonas humi]